VLDPDDVPVMQARYQNTIGKRRFDCELKRVKRGKIDA